MAVNVCVSLSVLLFLLTFLFEFLVSIEQGLVFDVLRSNRARCVHRCKWSRIIHFVLHVAHVCFKTLNFFLVFLSSFLVNADQP